MPQRGSPGRESAGDVQPGHDCCDVSSDGCRTHARAPRDRSIVKTLGHQLKYRLLRRVSRLAGAAGRFGFSGVARSHSISK